jgi:hypothetical protein
VTLRRTTTTAILVLVTGLAACGSDDEKKGDPIPQQAAADIEARLSEVERRMNAGGGACDDIQNDTKPAVDQIVASLPSGVDPDVRDALQQSVDHLFDLADEQCDTEKGKTTETPPPTVETTPETNTETTEPTETTPPETETTLPDTGTTEQPPSGQDGELPPGQGGENPGTGNSDGNGGGTFLPGEE